MRAISNADDTRAEPPSAEGEVLRSGAMTPVLLSMALAIAAQGAGDRRAEPDSSRGNRLVQVELIADRAAIRAGDELTLAVKLTVEPSWHVYWLNPGDSGIPTSFHFDGPPGMTIGEPRFPTPERDV